MPSNSWINDWITGDIPTSAEFRKSLGCIFDSTLGVAAATIDITPIPTTYAHLRVEAYLRGDAAATTIQGLLRVNNDSAANYIYGSVIIPSGTWTPTGSNATAATSWDVTAGIVPAGSSPANSFASMTIDIPHYAGATNHKQMHAQYSADDNGTAATMFNGISFSRYKSATAISRLTFLASSGNFAAGSRVSVYVMGS